MSTSKPLPTSMVAWQHYPRLFGADSFSTGLSLNQIAPVPELKKDETLVKVLTSAVNPIDHKLGELPFVGRMALGSPATPGLDFVGRVWATTLPDSAGIKPGDIVYGIKDVAKGGCLGAFTTVPGADSLAKAPAGVDIDQLGSIGVGGMTAYVSLVPKLETQGEGSARGKSVLINGASGGVGTYTVQFAKAIGCEHIVATCSSANAELVRSLGATEVIDYRTTNVADAAKAYVANKMGGEKFDHVVDNVGADLSIYFKSHEFLKEGGTWSQVGAPMSLSGGRSFATAMMLPGFLGGGKRKFEFVGAAPSRQTLDRIGQWMVEKKVKTVIDTTFPMEEVMEAYKRLKTGRARGKVLVRVSEDGRGDS